MMIIIGIQTILCRYFNEDKSYQYYWTLLLLFFLVDSASFRGCCDDYFCISSVYIRFLHRIYYSVIVCLDIELQSVVK